MTHLFLNRETKHIQSTTGLFLYYGRVIEYSILPALNHISASQSRPATKITEKPQQLMDFLNTHDNAFLYFYASNMVLQVDSNASYLVCPKTRRRVKRYYD